MEILHVSAECYPMAKAGGLGDVLGALPKYQERAGHIAKVVVPMYRTRYLYKKEWELVHEGHQQLGSYSFPYSVIRERSRELGFDLYLVDVNELLDRPNIYGYDDDPQRFLAFQVCVLDWVNSWKHRPDIIHVHDHHTGLIPFFMKYAHAFRDRLHDIPSVFTIHNAQYQGWLGWQHREWLPPHDEWKSGLLEWADQINPLAAAIKSAWVVTTVSPSYLDELRHQANGLEKLFEYEKGKCRGILNGIDAEVWDPQSDPLLIKNYSKEDPFLGKLANKESLCRQFGLDASKPLLTYIGRLVHEKAADLLPEAFYQCLHHYQARVSILLLGSGDPRLQSTFQEMAHRHKGLFGAYIGYYEELSHRIYAGADFLLMPSRVEPCGLNQFYAMRYGTLPLVRNTGGLRDTVVDMGDLNGFGIRFDQASVGDIVYSVGRALDLYEQDPGHMQSMQRHMMGFDHSWDRSAVEYLELYQSIR
ncbi:MAG: glycogen synthase [Bacteroidetes bacterium]|nr:glycogen synthase [Bacteroidota bacterium]